jgi:hypothetical protein
VRRILVLLVVMAISPAVVGFAAMVMSPSDAHAACVGFVGNHRAFVGQPPDLFFEAGVPSTQYIPQVYVNFNDGGVGYTDCGTSAISSLAAVKVGQTYCDVGDCQVGNYEQVDVANGYPQSGPTSYRVSGGEPYLQGPIPVIYDGTAPAGTSGTIDIALPDGEIAQTWTTIARVNVYIVAGTPPPTWFMVTSDAQTIAGDTLTLDNELLNNNPSAKIFAMHADKNTLWNHPIAATYNEVLERWAIRNEDGAKMPVGLEFVIRIDLSALTVTANGPYDHVVIDDPASNDNPLAVIVATPWSSGTSRMTHPFAVSYVAPHWVVRFTDGAGMPWINRRGRAGFFVKIIGAGQYADDNLATGDPSGINDTWLSNGAGTDIFGPLRQIGNTKYLWGFCWTQQYEPIIATWNETPLPLLAKWDTIEPKYYGVSPREMNVAAVFHEDGSPMQDTAPFNAWGPHRNDCPPQIPVGPGSPN